MIKGLKRFGNLVCGEYLFPQLPPGMDEIKSWDNSIVTTKRYQAFRDTVREHFYTESTFIGREDGKMIYGLICLRKPSSSIEEPARSALLHVSDDEFRRQRQAALAMFHGEPETVVAVDFKAKRRA